jgi:hypothetical protein
MKKLFTLFLLVLSLNVNAGIISLDVSDTDITNGEEVMVSILASDFAPTDTFNFDLVFDTSMFSYDDSSLTSDLFVSNSFSLFEVNAFDGFIAFSFLDFFDPISDTDFVLASFNLTALTEGNSDFMFENVEFYAPFDGGDAILLPVSSNSDINIQASAASVPEPSTWVLVVFALLTIGLMQQKRLFNK